MRAEKISTVIMCRLKIFILALKIFSASSSGLTSIFDLSNLNQKVKILHTKNQLELASFDDFHHYAVYTNISAVPTFCSGLYIFPLKLADSDVATLAVTKVATGAGRRHSPDRQCRPGPCALGRMRPVRDLNPAGALVRRALRLVADG